MMAGNDKKHKKKTAGILAAVCGVFFIGGVTALAYMMSRDAMSNVFTIGEVRISQYETTFPTKDEDEGTGLPGRDGVPDECELVIPYAEITKDPKVKNIGKADAVVFMKVTNPAEMLTLIGENGGRSTEALCDLFWMKCVDDSTDLHENHFMDGWVELSSLDEDLYVTDDPALNEEGRGKVYLFGYSTRLSSDEETVPLFGKVQNKKYGSRTISANEVEHIKVESFAIQADQLLEAGIVLPTDGVMDEGLLTKIYTIFFHQNEGRMESGTGFEERGTVS